MEDEPTEHSPSIPDRFQDDPEVVIEYLKASNAESLGDYLELLYSDYYSGDLTDSSRYYDIDGNNIGPIIDLAVQFGFVWERSDPSNQQDGTNPQTIQSVRDDIEELSSEYDTETVNACLERLDILLEGRDN